MKISWLEMQKRDKSTKVPVTDPKGTLGICLPSWSKFFHLYVVFAKNGGK